MITSNFVVLGSTERSVLHPLTSMIPGDHTMWQHVVDPPDANNHSRSLDGQHPASLTRKLAKGMRVESKAKRTQCADCHSSNEYTVLSSHKKDNRISDCPSETAVKVAAAVFICC